MNIPQSFDIKFNSQYRLINDNAILEDNTNIIFCIEIENSTDWQDFMNSDEISGVIIQNVENDNLDEIIDFENEELCNKIEFLSISSFIKCLSDNISRLTNLKYLSTSNISSISPSIKKLYNLETLILSNCDNLEYIPFEIYEMQSLRTLTINRLNYYENFSPRIHQLLNLESITLKDHYPFLSEEMTKIPKLKYLNIERPQKCVYDIFNLEALHIRLFESNLLDGIKKLTNLKELWLDIREFSDEINELSSLKYLIIYNYFGQTLPNLDKLYNLELLVLYDCKKLEHIPDFVFNLPNLKYLGLSNLDNLKTIQKEINDIPNLKYLELLKYQHPFYELPKFRSGLYVNKMVSWNSYERIN